jgi:flavin reductase (DIM6/NTAB) family NADH-FMN oxidoreductase RutF
MKAHARSTHEALRRIPYGVYIIGVRSDGEMNAMAASWVTQCSFDPPLLMVAIRKDSHTYDLIQHARTFSLNLIDKHNQQIVRTLEKPFHFMRNKIEQVEHIEVGDGSPILQEAFAYVECNVRDIYEPGDHALVIGQVTHADVREDGDPITCADMKWHYGG